MSTLGALVVRLEANIAEFNTAMEKAAHTAEHSMERVKESTEVARHALELFGIGLGALEFVELVKGSIELQDKLHNLSLTTKISVEDLTGLSLAAKQSGTDLDGVAKVIDKLAVNMGKDPAKFAALGITAKEPVKAFEQLAEVMRGIENPQQRAAVGAAALGKGWEVAGALLAQGGEKINEMVERGAQLSGVTAESAARAHEFADKMEEVKASVGRMSQTLVNDAMPSMLKITKAMADAAEEGGILKAAWVGFGGLASTTWEPIKTGWTACFKTVSASLAEFTASVDMAFSKVTFGKMSAELVADAERYKARAAAIYKEIADLGKTAPPPAPEAPPAPAKVIPKSTIDAFVGVPAVGATVADPWLAFIQSLDKMIAKSSDGVYAMLKLEAAQKSLGDKTREATAGAIIDDLQRQNSVKALDDYRTKLDAIAKSLSDQRALIGLNALDTALLTDKQRMYGDALATIEAAKKAGKPLDKQGEIDLYNATTAAIEKNRAAIIANIEATNSFATGAKKALNDYLDTATSAAAQSGKLFTDAFRGMEDSLVKFVRTGKGDFKSLANSIIDDLIRIQIQNSITKPLAGIFNNAIGSLFGGSTGAAPAANSMGGNFAMASFAVGTPYVPNDMIAQIHQGEKIVPANENHSTTDSGGSQPVAISFQITTNDSRSFQNSLAENKGLIVGIVNQALNGRGRPGISK